jgi:hypothetical protein
MRKALISAAIVLGLIFAVYPMGTTSNSVPRCGSCHSGFTAFSITIDAPTEVPAGDGFQYKAIVKNSGSHEVLGLKAKLNLENANTISLPQADTSTQTDTFSGDASPMSSGQHQFNVDADAMQAIVSLTGDPGLMNDIDLTVTSANGQSWESAGSGADEQIILNALDLENGGTGQYAIVVDWAIGFPLISYTINVEVSYGSQDAELMGKNLAPGDEYVFIWNMESSQEMGPNQVEVMITGTAYFQHNNPSTQSEETFSYTEGSEVVVGGTLQYDAPEDVKDNTAALKLIGRVSGMLLLFGLLASVTLVSGINLGKYSKYRMKVHCFGSFLLIPITGIHVVVLYLGPYRGLLVGFWSGLIDLAVISVLVYSGYDQSRFVKLFGQEKWKKYHYYLALLALFINLAHAVIYGTDFAGLR